MQSNDYTYDAYDYTPPVDQQTDEDGIVPGQVGRSLDINFDDPKIATLPKILLMGPRRGGKTSIQVRSLG